MHAQRVTRRHEDAWHAGIRVAAHENDSPFRLLAESLPQLVWTTRPDGRHDYFNGRWYEFTGLDLAGSVGEGWADVIHPDDRRLACERWRQALSSGRTYEV